MADESRHPVELPPIVEAATTLFDNRLGWSEGRSPHAPRDFWADLGAALYGHDDPRVVELRSVASIHPTAPTTTQAERVAEHFHTAYERLAPDHGYKTRDASAVAWEDVPEQNKGLMCAVIDELIGYGIIEPNATVVPAE